MTVILTKFLGGVCIKLSWKPAVFGLSVRSINKSRLVCQADHKIGFADIGFIQKFVHRVTVHLKLIQ